MQITDILKQFDINSAATAARPLAGGRVNETFLFDMADGTKTVLQRINTAVPIDPEQAMANICAVMRYLETHPGPLSFLHFYVTADSSLLYNDKEYGSWRAYRYVEGDIPQPGAPYSAAQMGRAIGALHRMLADFPVEQLYASTPDFHNTPRRFDDFFAVAKAAPDERLAMAKDEIELVLKQRSTCSALLDMGASARVTHGDAKLENLIVHPETLQPLCFVDYDNLMPGVLAFDFGDGARSCCKDCKTDERDMSRVQFQLSSFDIYSKEYLAQTRDILDDTEAVSLAMGAVVMSLELGIRYLTEYLTGEPVYFQPAYETQNLDRARVQLLMCLQMQKSYGDMVSIVKKHLTDN